MNKYCLSLFLFFTFSILSHNLAQEPFEWFATEYGHVILNRTVSISFIIIALFLFIYLYKKIIAHTAKRLLISYWIFFGALALGCYFTLMPYKTEGMHFIQYGIIGALGLMCLRRSFAALNLSFLLGFIDELWQFIVGKSVYLDFNDVILNFCGSLLGVLLVLTLSKPLNSSVSSNSGLDKIYFINLSIGLILFVGIGTNTICFFTDEGCPISLCKWETGRLSSNFWEHVSWDDYWHRIRPLTGAVFICLLPLSGYRLNKIH